MRSNKFMHGNPFDLREIYSTHTQTLLMQYLINKLGVLCSKLLRSLLAKFLCFLAKI